MISIIAVSWNSLRFTKLLVQSIRKFTTVPHELIIVDNASEDGSREWLEKQDDVKAILLDENIRHGPGLMLALSQAKHRYVQVFDSDSHVQRDGWAEDMVALYEESDSRKLIAAKGADDPFTSKKPIHAAVMFFERDFFLRNNLSFLARDGYDVGRHLYRDIVRLGYEVFRIPVCFEGGVDRSERIKFYGKKIWGDEYNLYQLPTFFHAWYSSRLYNFKNDTIDKFNVATIREMEKNLWVHPLIKSILSHKS